MMTELRSNTCHIKKNVDKYKGTKHRIKPKDSPIGSKGKIQHMLCTADIRYLQWGWI